MKKELTPQAIIFRLGLASVVSIIVIVYALICSTDSSQDNDTGIFGGIFTIALAVCIYGIVDQTKIISNRKKLE